MINPAEYSRPLVTGVLKALAKKHPFLHILTGPRQVGKTTAARQIAGSWKGETIFAAADSAVPHGPEWISAQLELALAKAAKGEPVLLVLDEIQKVRGWSETVKWLWDKELGSRSRPAVLLLGSSALTMQKGITESLAGRFLLYRFGHWNFVEMNAAFDFSLEEWIYYGGYPGAARFKGDFPAWASYITDSLIETVLSRDVLQLSTVAKPALLRHLFGLAAGYPSQILSYNKMLGQLQDAGNTTTLAHYLRLLETAYLASGLELFRGAKAAKRGTSPKLILWNNALVSAYAGRGFESSLADRESWGRLVENAVGAHLLNHLNSVTHQILYWRQRDMEVDFVIRTPSNLWALEVKSGRSSRAHGLAAFIKRCPKARPFIIGTGGMELSEFFSREPSELFH